MSYRGISNHFLYSGKTVEWFTSDNEDWYSKNLKNDYERLKQFEWIGKKIEYKFNSLGFRSEELDPDQNSVVFFGGSEVLSVGLPIEHSFTTLVSTALGLRCYNLGQSGGANDTVYRLASHWLPILKPKLVVFLSPPIYRIEVINTFRDNPFQTYLPYFHGGDPFFKTWLSCDDNFILNEEKNRIATDYICNINKIKYLRFDYEDFERIDRSRDLIHCGINSHRVFADRILSML